MQYLVPPKYLLKHLGLVVLSVQEKSWKISPFVQRKIINKPVGELHPRVGIAPITIQFRREIPPSPGLPLNC